MNIPWVKRRKIAPLPIPASPLMIAAALLDKVQQGEIKSLVVCTQTTKDTFQVSHSGMSTAEALFHGKMVQQRVDELFNE